MTIEPPNIDAFLAAPIADVAAVAPATMIFAPGGTRRRAMLAGISPQSETYAEWSRAQMIACCELWFNHGVQHIFMNVLRPAQLAETGHYRARVLNWLAEGLAGSTALADYARMGWRVRLIGTEELPELHDAAKHIHTATAAHAGQTLWFFVVPSADAAWQWLRRAILQAPSASMADSIQLLYGEPVPPATLFLGFGKPIIAPDLLPPLLAGELQCYWSQRPGYDLDRHNLRRIVYDYAYLRTTWTADKSARYQGVLEQQFVWEQSFILGMGRRLGDFWYPLQAHTEPDESGG